MPLPEKRQGQEQDSFVSSCMSSETMKREFPDHKQRLAVCFRQARKKALIKNALKILKTKDKEGQ